MLRLKGLWWVLILACFAGAANARAQQTLLNTGAYWTYWDWGFEPDPAWAHPNYDDFDWGLGPSPLGFGEPDIATQVEPFIITAYFRTYFVTDPAPQTPVRLRVRADDGVVLYLNGSEVFRTNMPAGPIDESTSAQADVEAGDFIETTLDPSSFVQGYNVLAAEVHQSHILSEDMVLDVQLVTGSMTVVRGPYLQMGTPTSMVVRWRTGAPTNSVVRYGLAPDNLNQTSQVNSVVSDHEVPLAGLSSDTKYYYSVGTSAATLSGGADHFFITAPNGPKPTRIWVIGDSGGASSFPPDFGSTLVRDAYYNYAGERYTDVWLLLGDNAYQHGTDDEYQRGFFNIYPQTLRQTVAWSTIGNHEFDPAYFDIFTFPRNGEAGGVASGVENYYSFDYGDIHFVNLGGYYSGSRLSNGVMCTWLKADLEANTNKWLIAYWHQPPYTKGSHDSDWEVDHVEMRQNAVPILESYGVDMILAGHSHVYERSFLLRGHYGYSWELEPEMKLDPGSGRVDDTGAYTKQTQGAAADHGTVYAVVGSSGWTVNCCVGLDHPAMYKALDVRGSLVIDINDDTLEARFVRETGAIDDYFTLVKESTIVRIVHISYENGTSTLSWTSKPGKSYQLEFTGNLPAGWTGVGNVIQATGQTTSTTHATGGPQGFYRVLQLD